MYEESLCADFRFHVVQSQPILSVFCAHRNHPLHIIKRIMLECLSFLYIFYMVLYYMHTPLTGAYGENGGMLISETVFGAFVAAVYRYIANTPWMRRPGISEEELKKADGCSTLFLVVMFFVSCSTLARRR